ncbi:hypothetical protein Emtol_0568 [Emticicia oligotrophica DSM 17448]|uniref:Outer membrane protein beta-barrel domain-containing protein n=1 Tax=Emticicia oligotrophica (strain DSM 17448 / CIP 109782 / MTCC 6937 / GPTSA100-15) TaxID=929562 RepID=A0ABM5MX69_EMTOG|nr:hypothetical protein [Emticicia oligotrophica]AFK01722.1 hypothetical protein Emtol_0568 [Emticicia oligotrophica DSM 17448]
MKRLILLLLFVEFLCLGVFAQTKSEKYLEDKASWYVGMNFGNAIGGYKQILKDGNLGGTKAGFVLGGLFNPYGRKRASTVFYGAEVGYQSIGRDKDFVSNASGTFYVTNNSFWLNGVARYRPILWSSKLNPYADAFFGAKIIRTAIVEQLSQDESEVLESVNKIVPNYGLGVGVGFKLMGQLKNAYLDLGIYLQQADPTKIVKPKTIEISSTYNTSYKQVLTNTNQIAIRLTLTGFD